MGLLSALSTQNKMKCFVVLSAVVACGFAAPAADADAQLLAGHGLLGHGLLGHGLVGGVYGAGHAVAAPVAVATAPVVQHVGYNVHHQVHHVPQVSVQKHVSTHTTSHVINHAPVVGAALAHGVVAAPAVAGVAGVVAV